MWYKAKAILSRLTKQEKKWFNTFLIVAVFCFSVLSALTFYRLTEPVPIHGGTFKEGLIGQPTFINPIISGNNDVDRDLTSLIFCSLGDIAAKIEPKEDFRSWHIRLKDSAFWHDGQPVSANDVIFTLNQINNPEFQSFARNNWQGVKMERVSEREIAVSLDDPFAFFENNTSRLLLVPEHLFSNIPINNWRLSDYNLSPIGCGPYRFDSFRKRSDGFITKYILKSNPNFVDGHPYIETIEINFYPDINSAIQDFNAGKIDGLSGLTSQTASLIKRPVNNFTMSTSRHYSVFINQTSHPGLNDKNVRLGLRTAINKKELIDKVLNGNGEPVFGPITPNFLKNNEDILDINPENLIEQANAVFDNSNWLYHEDDKIRSRVLSRGRVYLEFNMIVPDIDFLVKTARELSSEWKKVGVEINLLVFPPHQINNQIIPDRDFSLLLFGNALGLNPDLFSFWHSSQTSHPGLNLANYAFPAADRLIESIRQEMNPLTREQNISALHSLIKQEIPAIFLYSPNFTYLTSQKLRGFNYKLITTPSSRFSDVVNWYVKTAREFK